ncbi:MAG: F0F1 ATP synthase subunit delta [Candidatus Omnitrophota bacterium]
MLIQLIIIQVITFIAIVFVLRKLLYTETAKETRRLAELKEANARKEQELQMKLEEAEGAYRQKIAKVEEDAKRLRAKAEEEAEEIRQKTLARAREEAELVMKTALNAKEKIREEINFEMRKEVPALAAQMFKEVISARAKEMAHKELVKEVTKEIRALEKSRFSAKAKTIEVSSPYPLEKEEKSEVASAVCEKLGNKVPLEEKLDKELIAGIEVKVGTLIIDGSILNRLRQAKEALRKG